MHQHQKIEKGNIVLPFNKKKKRKNIDYGFFKILQKGIPKM